MRKDIRVLVYVVACLVVLLLPNIVSFIQIGWKWLDGYVVKENFLASVTLACIAIFVEFFYVYRHVFESQSKEKYAMSVSPFYFDSPTSSDLFNRKKYAKLLLEKIYSSFSNQERNNHSVSIQPLFWRFEQ